MKIIWAGLVAMSVVACGQGDRVEQKAYFRVDALNPVSVTANFQRNVFPPDDRVCTQPEQIGPCSMEVEVTCEGEAPTRNPTFSELVPAEVKVFGLTDAPVELHETHFDSATWFLGGPDTTITGGESVHFTSAGGDGPSLETESLIIPAPVTFTGPDCFASSEPFPDCGEVSAADGLTVAWTGGDNGTVTVTLVSAGVGAVCEAPASDGSLTVPSDVLSRLGHSTMSASAKVTSSKAHTRGDWDVLLQSSGPERNVNYRLR